MTAHMTAHMTFLSHLYPQLGTILDRNRHKDTVTVEMSLSKDVLTLGFDDVCEHVSTEHN